MSVYSDRDKLLLVQMSTSISGLQTLAAHIVSWRLDWYSSIHNRRLQDKIQVCCSWMLHKRIYSNINVLYVCIQLPAVTRGMLIGWIAPGLFMFFVDVWTEIWWWKTLKTSSFFFKLVLFLEMFFITLSNFDVSVLFCLWSFIFHMMFLTSGPPCFIYWLPTSVDSLHCLPSGLQHKLSKFKLEMLDGEMLRKWRKLTSHSLDRIVNILLSMSFEIRATSVTKPES